MKKLTWIVIFFMMIAFVPELKAQKMTALDASPADIAYFRPDGRGTTPVIKVIYGRPAKKGRTMLGEKDPYGKIWRVGANETTEIKLYRDVTFGDKKIPAGTYSLYAIPNKDQWTIIFNSKLDTWGPYEYEEGKDVARINVPAGKSESEIENFTIVFEGEKGTGSGNMVFGWENTMVKIPFKY
jgi:hypothetical protein